MAKATIFMPDGSQKEAETIDVPKELEAKIFLIPRVETREIVLAAKSGNPEEESLLVTLALLASKGKTWKLKHQATGLSIVNCTVPGAHSTCAA